MFHKKELIENYLLDKEVVEVVKALTKLPKRENFLGIKYIILMNTIQILHITGKLH